MAADGERLDGVALRAEGLVAVGVDLPRAAVADRHQVAALAGRQFRARHQQPGGRQVRHADHRGHRFGAGVRGVAGEIVARQQEIVGRPEMMGHGPQIGVAPRHVALQAPVRLRAVDVDDAGDLGRVVVLLDAMRYQEAPHVDADGGFGRAVGLERGAGLHDVVHGLGVAKLGGAASLSRITAKCPQKSD